MALDATEHRLETIADESVSYGDAASTPPPIAKQPPTTTPPKVGQPRRATVPIGERPWKVLVAEDDAEMRGLIVQWLESEGYRVIECGTGLELADYLLFTDAGGIDLVISDIRMPDGTGLEVLKAVQWIALPPIIVITAFGDQQTHCRALQLGAVTCLDKPFDREELMACVRALRSP